VAKVPVVFARITGKGNIRRYREFFTKFGVRTPVIADLDLLVNGFNHIAPSDAIKMARDKLLEKVDESIVSDESGPSAKDAKDAYDSNDLRGLWRKVRESTSKLLAGECTQAEHEAAVEAFFAWQRKADRLAVLKTSTDAQMLKLKYRLLEMLRGVDIYVLERGAIEQYYPAIITGADKPSRAQDFCTKVATRDEILACCGEQSVERNGALQSVKEFDLIFQGIFKKSLW
jgi:putative ATP-dependent endonuclease of the OLD family